jgi:integrating conjugative element protein (TIGR03749 family)
MRRSAGALIVFGLLAATSSRAVEMLHWDHLPLPVPLIVGEERVVILDRPVRIGLPAALEGRLRVQSADGAVYLRASAPTSTTRLELQDMRTGELILLDVTARRAAPHEAPLEPIRIVDDLASGSREDARADDVRQPSASGPERPRGTPPTPLAVALTRYAAQSLYAPLRTVEPLPGVTSVAVAASLPLDTLLPALPVRATALAAWRLDGECVTAVKLTNTSARWIDLDPRALQGDFVAATFQHPNLGPAGRSTDTTVVYLITRGGIGQHLLPHTSRFDAALDLPRPAASRSRTDARGHTP